MIKLWWRRWESNPCPKKSITWPLHAYPFFKFRNEINRKAGIFTAILREISSFSATRKHRRPARLYDIWLKPNGRGLTDVAGLFKLRVR